MGAEAALRVQDTTQALEAYIDAVREQEMHEQIDGGIPQCPAATISGSLCRDCALDDEEDVNKGAKVLLDESGLLKCSSISPQILGQSFNDNVEGAFAQLKQMLQQQADGNDNDVDDDDVDSALEHLSEQLEEHPIQTEDAIEHLRDLLKEQLLEVPELAVEAAEQLKDELEQDILQATQEHAKNRPVEPRDLQQKYNGNLGRQLSSPTRNSKRQAASPSRGKSLWGRVNGLVRHYNPITRTYLMLAGQTAAQQQPGSPGSLAAASYQRRAVSSDF